MTHVSRLCSCACGWCLRVLMRCLFRLQDAADYEERRSVVGSLLSTHGQSLVSTLVQSSIFCLPTSLLADVAETLYELLQYDRQALGTWLESALKLLPTQSSGGAVTATPDQLSEFLATVTSAQHVINISSSLREFSRLYR